VDTNTSGVASGAYPTFLVKNCQQKMADLSMLDQQQQQRLFHSSRWSLSIAAADADEIVGATDAAGNGQSQWMMRRSETVPPTSHPESSLLHLCTFPSMEIHHKRPPLPPLTPLPADEEGKEEKRENDGG
jgi:hypothetical protein